MTYLLMSCHAMSHSQIMFLFDLEVQQALQALAAAFDARVEQLLVPPLYGSNAVGVLRQLLPVLQNLVAAQRPTVASNCAAVALLAGRVCTERVCAMNI